MIAQGSRYEGNQTEKVTVGGAVREVLVSATNAPWAFNFTYYQWEFGDRPDLLSAAWYGDDRLWWTIANANPEVLDWLTIQPGTVIRIPSV